MQLSTGEVRVFDKDQSIPSDFTTIPKKHEEEAHKILGGKTSAFADMGNDNSPLVCWARGQKRNKEAKAKTKMQKASRQKNRK